MTDDLAQAIRRGWRPEGEASEMEDLTEQARRLERGLAVAEEWMEAAGESPEMGSRTLYTREQIEEELARVAFEMEVRGWARDAEE
jgi:hypothetical protein